MRIRKRERQGWSRRVYGVREDGQVDEVGEGAVEEVGVGERVVEGRVGRSVRGVLHSQIHWGHRRVVCLKITCVGNREEKRGENCCFAKNQTLSNPYCMNSINLSRSTKHRSGQTFTIARSRADRGEKRIVRP